MSREPAQHTGKGDVPGNRKYNREICDILSNHDHPCPFYLLWYSYLFVWSSNEHTIAEKWMNFAKIIDQSSENKLESSTP